MYFDCSLVLLVKINAAELYCIASGATWCDVPRAYCIALSAA